MILILLRSTQCTVEYGRQMHVNASQVLCWYRFYISYTCVRVANNYVRDALCAEMCVRERESAIEARPKIAQSLHFQIVQHFSTQHLCACACACACVCMFSVFLFTCAHVHACSYFRSIALFVHVHSPPKQLICA